MNYQPLRRIGCHQRAFTIVELLVAMAIVSLLISLILPAVQFARESSRVVACQNHLRQLALACHSYEGTHRHFPPGHVGGVEPAPNDLTQSSWVGHLGFLLPHLEQTAVYESLSPALFGWPFDPGGPAWFISPGIRTTAAGVLIPVFQCPSDVLVGGEGTILALQYPWVFPDTQPVLNGRTNYLGCDGVSRKNTEDASGRNLGIFFSRSQVRVQDISDGLSSTLLLGEVLGNASRVAPDTITHKHSFLCGAVSLIHFGVLEIGNDIGPASSQMFRSRHAGFVNAAFADGSGRKIVVNTDVDVLAAIGSRAGSEVIGEF